MTTTELGNYPVWGSSAALRLYGLNYVLHNANMETVILRLCLTEAEHPLGFQFPVSAKDEKKHIAEVLCSGICATMG